MATKRVSWKFFLGYGIKHVSESDVWTIHDMPSFEYVACAHSLIDARKKIFRELPLKNAAGHLGEYLEKKAEMPIVCNH